MLCKCYRGGTGGSVGPCVSGGSDNLGVSDGVFVAMEEQVSVKKKKKKFRYLKLLNSKKKNITSQNISASFLNFVVHENLNDAGRPKKLLVSDKMFTICIQTYRKSPEATYDLPHWERTGASVLTCFLLCVFIYMNY